jgi:hypothetical protein
MRSFVLYTISRKGVQIMRKEVDRATKNGSERDAIYKKVPSNELVESPLKM